MLLLSRIQILIFRFTSVPGLSTQCLSFFPSSMRYLVATSVIYHLINYSMGRVFKSQFPCNRGPVEDRAEDHGFSDVSCQEPEDNHGKMDVVDESVSSHWSPGRKDTHDNDPRRSLPQLV